MPASRSCVAHLATASAGDLLHTHGMPGSPSWALAQDVAAAKSWQGLGPVISVELKPKSGCMPKGCVPCWLWQAEVPFKSLKGTLLHPRQVCIHVHWPIRSHWRSPLCCAAEGRCAAGTLLLLSLALNPPVPVFLANCSERESRSLSHELDSSIAHECSQC